MNLNQTVWARLGPSKIHGIGVIAIRDIPKGTVITDWGVEHLKSGVDPLVYSLSEDEFKQILPEIRALILDRSLYNSSVTRFECLSPNSYTPLQSFMNHSRTPNTDGRVTLVDVKKGEELTEDFREVIGGKEFHEISREHIKDFV